MEFVVGQWVEWCDDAVRVLDMQPKCGLIGVDINGERRWVQEENVKPFIWQVGKTYRTTLEGVTATIKKLDSECDLIGPASNDECDNWAWSQTTGLVRTLDSDQTVPHLLPYLADEPCDPGPTLAERYTVGQLGTLWGVFDQQSMMFARFSGKEVAEDAIRYIDEVYDELAWWRIENSDMPEVGPQDDEQRKSRYHRTIKGVTIDLYDIAAAYGVTGHAEFHALKKIIMAGNRGYKDRDQDLAEAIVSIERAREMAKGGA